MHRVMYKSIRAMLQVLCDELVSFHHIEAGVYAPYELEECEESDGGAYEEYVETDINLRNIGWDERYDNKSIGKKQFLLVEYNDARCRDENTVDRVLLEVKVVFYGKTKVLQCYVVDPAFVNTLLADLLVESVATLAEQLELPFCCRHHVSSRRRLK